MKLPVAILAGGLATRLKLLTETIPKSLVEVAGKPFIFHQLELLASYGIEHVVLCVGHLGEQVNQAVGDGSRWNLKVDYCFDGPVQLGTGGALKKAVPYLGDAFLILYGDSYLDCDYPAVAEAFSTSNRPGLMTVFRNCDRWDRSNVAYSKGMIHAYDKKCPTPDMQHIDYGLGALRAEVLNDYPAGCGLDLATIYQDLVATNQLTGFEIAKRFYEIGSIDGLRETDQYLSHRNADQLHRAISF
jgi:N-acetyl-alpha-D-muramate 1-phosphate uridylyltransferase